MNFRFESWGLTQNTCGRIKLINNRMKLQNTPLTHNAHSAVIMKNIPAGNTQIPFFGTSNTYFTRGCTRLEPGGFIVNIWWFSSVDYSPTQELSNVVFWDQL